LQQKTGALAPVNNPQPCSFQISNSQNEADLSNSWASSESSVLADIFGSGNEISYSEQSQKSVGNNFVLNFSCRAVRHTEYTRQSAVAATRQLTQRRRAATRESDCGARARTSPGTRLLFLIDVPKEGNINRLKKPKSLS